MLLPLMLIIISCGSFHTMRPNWKIFQQRIQNPWRVAVDVHRDTAPANADVETVGTGRNGIFPVVSAGVLELLY